MTDVLEHPVRPATGDVSRQLKPKTFSTQETIEYVPPNATESSDRAHMFFEDKEAVIKMIIKGGSPHWRHVSRTHRLDLDMLV